MGVVTVLRSGLETEKWVLCDRRRKGFCLHVDRYAHCQVSTSPDACTLLRAYLCSYVWAFYMSTTLTYVI